jgi:hypothetical protein
MRHGITRLATIAIRSDQFVSVIIRVHIHLMQFRLFALSFALVAGPAACATAGGHSTMGLGSQGVTEVSGSTGPSNATEIECTGCTAMPMPSDVTQAIEHRLADLELRGGDCSRYGRVLASSYRTGRITLRPYMWRVGRHLASGEAKPNGDMTLAREIDSLNVGLRTVDDVMRSIEHEAVHIAFALPSGCESSEEKADATVRASRPQLSALLDAGPRQQR